MYDVVENLEAWQKKNKFAHDQQKLSLPSQQIFNDRAQKDAQGIHS